jgi:hypothetical protein
VGLFRKKQPTPVTAHWAEEVLPHETDIFAHGVSHQQQNIRALGKGPQRFALVGDAENKYDKHAVKVCAVTPAGLATVGFLPAGEYKTEHFQTLALALEQQETLLIANGTIESYEGGLGVRVQLPKWAWLKARLASLQIPW